MAEMNPVSLLLNPTALKPTPFAGIVGGLCGLCALLIALRLWTNFNHHKLFVDDYLSVLSLLFIIWNSVAFTLLAQMFNSTSKDVSIRHFTNLAAVGIASANCAVPSSKLPLLFLLKRTFGIKEWMRWSCLVIIVSNILAGLAIVIYGTVECSPELHPNTAPFLLGCIVAVDNTTMARASISLATDVAVFILPIPVIVNLNMAFRRKIGLGLAFATGLLAIVASTLGVYYQYTMLQSDPTNAVNAQLVIIIESVVVLMVSCTPALHLFWSKNGDFLRNNYLLTLLTSHNKSATHQSNKNRSSSSEIDQIKIVQQHSQETQYLELEEGLESGSPLYEAWAHSSDRHASF